ncbi:MAG: DUF3500 domain-containing protein [Acidobacteria bacterium]|nr:DUF3500 domain-containing protein [Acidobacteriota bacterium]
MNRPVLQKFALISVWCGVFAFVAYFGWQSYAKVRAHAAMAEAANKFIAALNAEQKAKATKGFDDTNREDWHFIPRDRQGLPLKQMTEAQRQLAHALLQTGVSAYGYKKVNDILSLEPVLRVMEGPDRRFPRDETLYYVTVFGTPGAKDRWGWRWEGHHMSLNFTVVKGELIASVPLMFGSNPAEVRQGDRKGFRALANEEDKGRALITALDEKQRATAIYDAKAPGDILNMPEVKDAKVLAPAGIAYSALTKPQQAMLVAIVDEYLNRTSDEQAKLRRERLNKAGWNNVTFAWAGGVNKGDLHYYRVQGATFLIEYDNTQNNGNHIHSAWRDFNGDFGRDLIREHYQATPHKAEAAAPAKSENAAQPAK